VRRPPGVREVRTPAGTTRLQGALSVMCEQGDDCWPIIKESLNRCDIDRLTKAENWQTATH